MKKEDILEEKKHLKEILTEINSQTKFTNQQLDELEEEMKQLTHNFSEEFYGMDNEEQVNGGDDLDEHEAILIQLKNKITRLKKQYNNPYFGKIIFRAEDEDEFNSYYVGTFSLTDGTSIPAICDWRAPISSIYYNYEIGKCNYAAPSKTINGEMIEKRQFKIKDSKMVMCFDSSLTIGDNILQQELAQNANQKMKTIVSTIQKEQNEIIRQDDGNVILVQGVAGSGKTSIALHKIAYLLYSTKGLKSSDVLIISPNKIFSEYISSILPELGEENMLQTTFYSIAKQELSGFVPVLQTREEMIEELIDCKTERINHVCYKNCIDYFESLKIYLHDYINVSFKATDMKFGDVKICASELDKLFSRNYKDKKPSIRIDWIADYITDQLNLDENKAKLVIPKIKKMLLPMMNCSNLIDIYTDFLSRIGLKFELSKNGKLLNEDIAGILYIKNYLLGIMPDTKIKYLVVDEMQDYSYTHFAIFDEIFDCKKIILGDIYQCIEKIMTNDDLNNMATLLGANKVTYLNKTYRSTYEIVEYADRLKNKISDKVERHGSEVMEIRSNDINQEIENINGIIKQNSNYETIAIICKDEKQMKEYYSLLGEFEDLKMIGDDSSLSRLMIMPASVSKGLEFDVVIVVNATKQNYNNFITKNLLYVSSTRALHKLYFTYSGEKFEI